jgi:membrane protein DedA with SNARE-associated domain
MITIITEILVDIISKFGYLGLFLIMTLDACFVPLQSEISLPLAGFLSSEGKINPFIVVLIGAVGNTFGAFLMYSLGRKFSEKKILSFIKKYGKYVLLKQEDYTKIKKLFSNKGLFFVLVGRVLPGIRSVMSLPAGVLQIPQTPFLALTFSGSAVWSSVLVFLGYKLGENWLAVEGYISKFEDWIIACGIVLVIIYVWKKLKSK